MWVKRERDCACPVLILVLVLIPVLHPVGRKEEEWKTERVKDPPVSIFHTNSHPVRIVLGFTAEKITHSFFVHCWKNRDKK